MGKITMPRIQRAIAMRERGMSWNAIAVAMEVYEGCAPTGRTIRRHLLAAGVPKRPRGVPLNGSTKR